MSSIIKPQQCKHCLANKCLFVSHCSDSKKCPKIVWYSLLSNWQTTFGTPDPQQHSLSYPSKPQRGQSEATEGLKEPKDLLTYHLCSTQSIFRYSVI